MVGPHDITAADVIRCPIRSLSARHYLPDGSCRCSSGERPALCETCKGSGVIRNPKADSTGGEPLIRCVACNGEGVR